MKNFPFRVAYKDFIPWLYKDFILSKIVFKSGNCTQQLQVYFQVGLLALFPPRNHLYMRESILIVEPNLELYGDCYA